MLQIIYDGSKYYARLSRDEKARVEKAGFHWDQRTKKFVSHSHEAAYRLVDFMLPEAREVCLAQLSLDPLNPDLSLVSWPEGKKPYAHQLEFVKWALTRRVSYIAGEPGTGKTPASVICMNAEPGLALVICPAFLALNWKDEIESWTTWQNKPQVEIIKGQKDFVSGHADIYIYPISLMHIDPIREDFFQLKKKFKWIFIDEAHYFKSEDAKRSVSLFGGDVSRGNRKKIWAPFKKLAEHLVYLSGSPIPNGRPMELWPILNRTAPHVMGFTDKHNYGVKFCAGVETEFGWDYKGASNLEEWNKNLTRDFMIVKTLAECVDLPPMLPPKLIYLEDDRTQKLRESEMRILETVKVKDIIAAEVERNEAFRERVEHATTRASAENQLFVSGGFQFISELRKHNGVRKVPQAIKVIKEILDDLDELVVFAWHKEVIEGLAEGLAKYEPYVITGSTTNKKRHAQVKDFQNSKTRNLFLLNIEAGGVGITVTKAARYLFVEPSWVPGQNDQAIKRVYRISQLREVHGGFLVWKNSMDHLVLNSHQNKEVNIDLGIFRKQKANRE